MLLKKNQFAVKGETVHSVHQSFVRIYTIPLTLPLYLGNIEISTRTH